MAMKKIIAPILAAVLIASAGVVFAADEASTTVATSTPFKPRPAIQKFQNIKEERRDIKMEIKDMRVDAKDRLKDLRLTTKESMKAATSTDLKKNILEEKRGDAKRILQERKASTTEMKRQLKALTRQHFAVTIERYSIALKQFNNLAARIKSRIEKVKASGIDATSAERALANARTSIETARVDAKAVSDKIVEVSDESDVRAARIQIAEAIKKANASFKAAHRSLGAAASALALLHQSQKFQATSTQN